MLGRLLRIAVPVVLAAAAGLTASAGTGQAAAVPDAVPGWRIVATLPSEANFNTLTATGPANAWTVGAGCSGNCTGTTLLIRHWNGKAWRAIAAPKAFVNSATLVAPTAVVAVGSSAWIMAYGSYTTAVLHWTGKGWGKTVVLPAEISAAVAPTATDIWAFGIGTNDDYYAAHYNGTTWTTVRVPVDGSAAYATSAKDIWVFGSQESAHGLRLAIMVFNGKVWRTTPLPSLPREPMEAVSIAAASARDAWASAQILVPGPSVPPILLHWNGKTWAEVTVPYNGSGGNLALDGHGGIWLGIVAELYPVHGYFLHYAGGKWSRVAAPASRGDFDVPDVLAWIPGTRSLWATGIETPTSGSGPNPAVILKDGV